MRYYQRGYFRTGVWAKTYSNGQCSGLSITSDETLLYFSSAYTSYFAFGEVNCTDGSLIKYKATSTMSVNGKVKDLYIFGSGSDYFVIAMGNVEFNSPYSWTLNLTYASYVASEDTLYLNAEPTSGDRITGLSNVLIYQGWNGRYLFYGFVNIVSGIELYMIDATVGINSAIWHHNISCPSSCPIPDYAKSDFNQPNAHLAFNLPSEGKALVIVFAVDSGNLVGNMKTTQSSQQLSLGSLDAYSDTITWISMYSSSSSYSELIKYDSANNNSTVYQQSGVSYLLQHINLNSNDSWFGMGLTQYISNSTQNCMSEISGLTVSTTTSGLNDASSYSIAAGSQVRYFLYPASSYINDTITSTTGDLDYNYTIVVSTQTTSNNETNKNEDDGLSTEEIVGIALGSVFALALIIVIALIIIYIHRKTTIKYAGRQEVKTETQGEDRSQEKANDERPQQKIQDNQV